MSDPDRAVDPEEVRRMERALLRLSPRRRNIALLFYKEGMSLDEIARAYCTSRRRILRNLGRTSAILQREVFDNQPQPFWLRWWP